MEECGSQSDATAGYNDSFANSMPHTILEYTTNTPGENRVKCACELLWLPLRTIGELHTTNSMQLLSHPTITITGEIIPPVQIVSCLACANILSVLVFF